MEKSCEACYWNNSHYCRSCEDYFEFEPICCKCDVEVGEYKYRDITYCPECMMKELGIKKKEVSFYKYYVDNDFVGNDSDYSDNDIIRIVNKEVECLVW